MLRSNTHFEQVPIEIVKALVPKEIHENENARQIEQTKEKDSKTSLKAEE